MPPKDTKSPNTISVCTLSRYWRCFLIVFPLRVLVIVANKLIVDGRRPQFTRLALVSAVRCFLLRNCLQPKILWIFSDLNCVLFSHGAGVNKVGIGGILVMSS